MSGRRNQRGAVLLEVVLALALFVFAAATISGGLNAAASRVERLRLQAHAVDRAATVMAELQLGIRPLSNSGEEPLPEPFDDWTARVETGIYTFGSGDVAGLTEATVVIRHKPSDTTFRLTEILPATPLRAAPPAGAETGTGQGNGQPLDDFGGGVR